MTGMGGMAAPSAAMYGAAMSAGSYPAAARPPAAVPHGGPGALPWVQPTPYGAAAFNQFAAYGYGAAAAAPWNAAGAAAYAGGPGLSSSTPSASK